MALTSVKMTEEVWLTCLSHALSTETEEIMGLLLGDTQVAYRDPLWVSRAPSPVVLCHQNLFLFLPFLSGPREKIPTKIEIVDDGLIYSRPVWVEWSVIYRSMEAEKRADRGDSDIQLDSIEAEPMLLEYRDSVRKRKRSRNKENLGHRDWGETKHPSKHLIMDWEVGTGNTQANGRRRRTKNQKSEIRESRNQGGSGRGMTEEGDVIAIEGKTNSYCMSRVDSSFLETFGNQLVTYNESEPLSIEENLMEEMIEKGLQSGYTLM
ncbi:hypothetical protein MTR67_028520 [Solanum verrucosum]|uniref:Uncharacterized protein n=1 Tax=Solanum verrucosum TaxID=315347 RepID=A0AAF0R6A2_SOLVR|nr:hypothetical protein MTR67_028520 [Solanum verrucosum]